ncbi:hypothetical protein LUZ61_003100 [Rhynchospora tenuis]|uniref:S-acyltransferase n=1 Tax=Rhynchospora tenuis TaxID=198213 RepID=A0AAD5ZK64_9POAL|nr:hypothetical protein LUZ61_003100 [Rhynchospora tenuis]
MAGKWRWIHNRNRRFNFNCDRSSGQMLSLSTLLSALLVLASQLALASVPRFFSSLSLVAMLPLAGFVFFATIVCARWLRKLAGVSASPPAFVLFNILFLWVVYIFVIRQAISSLLDAFLNAECALLLFGLYRIFSSDPGIVQYESSLSVEAQCKDLPKSISSSENIPVFSRVRYCSKCKANIRGFDHHCPAFGNCIGQKNHRLFIILLTGFVIAESTYTMCSTKFITRSLNTIKIGAENQNAPSLYVVISTMLFSVLQVLWQVVFLMWHVYCILFNIKTEEWINWNKYPEFQLKEESQLGNRISFTNPYDKGFIGNIKEFLKPTF